MYRRLVIRRASLVLAWWVIPLAIAACASSFNLARAEVTGFAAENGWHPPDDDLLLEVLNLHAPVLSRDSSSRDLLASGYFACHSLGEGDDVAGLWVQGMTESGRTRAQVHALLASAMESLCPWHLEANSQ